MMKITAGLGRLEDFEEFAACGADEMFCGFSPWEWLEKYGARMPMNRREALLYPVQIAAWADMRILARLSRDTGVPVAVAFNSTCYGPEQYPLLRELILRLRDQGFSRFIVADPALTLHLRGAEGLQLYASGEFGEINPDAVERMQNQGARRIIFHRKVSISEMAEIARRFPGLEYEAFALNERCHYTGAFCNCLHGDGLPPLCRAPWRIGGVNAPLAGDYSPPERDANALGGTGCGLCALAELQKAGVTHLKLVGRGNRPERMKRDIRALKTALDILRDSPASYIERMRRTLFPNGCCGACYYPAPDDSREGRAET